MYRITYVLGDLSDPELARQQLLVMNGALVETNVLYLRAHPRTPSFASWCASKASLYDDNAQGTQPFGQEAWQDVPTILRRRRDGRTAAGNRDLAAWRAAELIVSGVRAGLQLDRRAGSNGAIEYRVLVVTSSGTEDPSKGSGYRAYHTRQRITLVMDLFSGEHERQLSHATLNVLLNALTHIDVLYLRRHSETPRIYTSSVRYMEEPPGAEEWQDIPTCLQMGDMDCEDAACWRSAELQVFGDEMHSVVEARRSKGSAEIGSAAQAPRSIDAVPVFRYQKRKDGSYLYHILVEKPDGTVEDPSYVQGMR